MKIVKGVSHEMKKKTQYKFDSWDEVISKDLLNGSEKQKAYVYHLLQDPTIYFYAFFKDPRNPDESFRMYPYQDVILNDPNKRIIFAAANQIGKSICLCAKALFFALMNPGKTVVMFSRTLPQSKDLLRQIKMFLRNCTLDYKSVIGDSETKTEIYFKHYSDSGKELAQSRIICVPATEGALGFAVDLELIDELAFYDNGEYFYFQIAQPRTYTTKGQIIAFSNPNGQMGVFWSLWNNKAFSKYNFNFLDCPTNTQKEYDDLKGGMTLERADSTLNGIFTSPEGGFLSLDERKRMQDNRPNILPSVFTQPVYIFFDWAKSVDRTVRTIAIPKKTGDNEWSDEVYVYEMLEYPQNTPYSDIIDVDLKSLVQSNSSMVAMVGWDNSGVGKGLEDFVNRVQDLGVIAMPVEFSLQNKSRIYTLFKLLAENGRIHLPFDETCDNQLASLRFKRTARGMLQVHHDNEKDRDDFPDSIAGVCSLIIQPENAPVTCEII